jgi:hypothetical protein
MKELIVVALLMLAIAPANAANEGTTSRLVLPNPKLLRCKSAECFQLWPEKSLEANVIFPKQMRLDMDQGCLYGMTALYDKSISVDELKTAIDESYRTWAYGDSANSTLKLWRVTPEKFAIQLNVVDKKDEKREFAEAGTKLVIYIAFAGGGRSACSIP